MGKTKICCGFGHREIRQNIEARLAKEIESAIAEQGVTVFYTGGQGRFDALFASAVRTAKQKHSRIKLVLVKPYFSNELNTNKAYYEALFDDVIIPQELLGVHYKSAITQRNRFMAEQADLIICFVAHEHGGAYAAVQYAKTINKPVINLWKEPSQN